MQICKKTFLYEEYVRDYIHLFSQTYLSRTLILFRTQFIQNTSFSFTTFSLPKVKTY